MYEMIHEEDKLVDLQQFQPVSEGEGIAQKLLLEAFASGYFTGYRTFPN